MRIVFIGTVEFSYTCLKAIGESGVKVAGILTQSRDQARFNSDWADLRPLGKTCGAPVHYFHKISSPEALEIIRSLRPDVVFVLGLSQLLPRELLQIPSLGVIGSHPALLPENRGRHPLIWALVKGFTNGGLTFFYIDEGIDSGDIVMQREFPIAVTDTARDLYEKIKALGARMVQELIPLRKRTKEDGLIPWEAGAWKSYNLIRALTHPYVGAHTFFNGKEIKVWSAWPPESIPHGHGKKHVPGEILGAGGQGITVFAGDGPLRIGDLGMDLGTVKVGEVLGHG